MNLSNLWDTLPVIVAFASMASIVRFGFIDGLFVSVWNKKISNGMSILAKIGSSIGMGFLAYHLAIGVEMSESVARVAVIFAGLFPEETFEYLKHLFKTRTGEKP